MDMDEEDVKPKINDEDLSKIKVDGDDLDLQFALNKARRLKQRKQFDHDRTAKFLEENGLHTKVTPIWCCLRGCGCVCAG